MYRFIENVENLQKPSNTQNIKKKVACYQLENEFYFFSTFDMSSNEFLTCQLYTLTSIYTRHSQPCLFLKQFFHISHFLADLWTKWFFDEMSKEFFVWREKSVKIQMNYEQCIVIDLRLFALRHFFVEIFTISFFMVVHAECIAGITVSHLG